MGEEYAHNKFYKENIYFLIKYFVLKTVKATITLNQALQRSGRVFKLGYIIEMSILSGQLP